MHDDGMARHRWLRTGDEAFDAMLELIRGARESVRLEMYIFTAGNLTARFREALEQAVGRGVQVRVLIDAWGSQGLPDHFWDRFVSAGGEFRWFNPLHYTRLGYRDHRKILAVDGRVAVVGGFNIAPEYEGDGVGRGWRDIGMRFEGDLAKGLEKAFDEIFGKASFDARRLPLLRKSWSRQVFVSDDVRLLLGGPGLGSNFLKKSLHRDLHTANSVRMVVAYFLPTWGILRLLVKCARRGGKVQLMLPAKSDVVLSQLASRSLYQRLLRAGVEIYEYEPQILHAKMYVIDSAVYVGSANLDRRSLSINFELLVRVQDARLVGEANRFFDEDLARSRRIDRAQWRKTRTFWQKLKEQWALLILGRLDPFIARRQLESLR